MEKAIQNHTNLIILPDELHNVRGIFGELSCGGSLYDLAELRVDGNLRLGDGEDDVDLLLGHLGGDLADGGVVLSQRLAVVVVRVQVAVTVIGLHDTSKLNRW